MNISNKCNKNKFFIIGVITILIAVPLAQIIGDLLSRGHSVEYAL